ncbi:DUF916 and DUF3324 domain-containing protein [uncultured Vagococcus sp.]|uniref:DUF916 and DUF3324 domain-containing protein n=1 Tax=uncultured Vagococcus sp. TaxID=189676 RepID=UPI0028D894D8|nr:DUF916 and DUF3324 domain-containing protein [uncultured Vagococcus sp.]
MAQKSKPNKAVIVLWLITGLLFVCFSPKVTQASGLNFDVEVVTPENQIDKQQTYFDLLVKPNQSQELLIKITSLSDKEIVIDANPNIATTNQNGEVSYSEIPGVLDSTLTYPVTSMLSKKQRVRLAPKEMKEIIFQLKIPKKAFDGKVVGGFLFQEVMETSENFSSKGINIDNYFALVKGIQLQESFKKIKQNIEIKKITATALNYKRAITVNLQNTESDFIRELAAEVKVKRKGSSDVLYERKQRGISMAPNSHFDFPIFMDNQELKSGDFLMEITLTGKDFNKSRTKPFTISKELAEEINGKAVDLVGGKASQSIVMKLVLSVCILLIPLTIIIGKWFVRKNGKKTISRK